MGVQASFAANDNYDNQLNPNNDAYWEDQPADEEEHYSQLGTTSASKK